MLKILVCFDDNDYLVTRINCTLEEAKKYYIGKLFTFWDGTKEGSHKAVYVLDIDTPFRVSYSNDVLPEYEYLIEKLDYPNLTLWNETTKCNTTIEPAWLWKFDKREVVQ